MFQCFILTWNHGLTVITYTGTTYNNKNSSDSCNEIGNLTNEIILDNRTLIIMILLHYQSAQYMR